MNKGERHTMTVAAVYNITSRTTGGKLIHTIEFKDRLNNKYIAEEASDNETSAFKQDTQATFEVMNPGKAGKADWVKFISSGKAGDVPLNRDHLEIAKVSFSAAVHIGVKNDWTEEQIMEKAFFYAIKIKTLAESL